MQRKQLVLILIIATIIGSVLLNPLRPRADVAAAQPAPMAAPQADDAMRFQQIAAILKQTETGQQMLNEIETDAITVRFVAGAGSTYRLQTNTITLDASMEPLEATVLLAHELTHARYLHDGRKLRLDTPSRDDYVAGKIQEEVDAVLASIKLKLELVRVDSRIAELTIGLENEYRRACIDAGQKLNACRAGEAALLNAFYSGQARTSNSGQSYVDYYRNNWDDAHPARAFFSNILDNS